MNGFRTIRTKLGIGFAIGPVILLIVGWITFSNTQELIASSKLQEHTHAVREQIDVLTNQLLNAETGQRGYVLTGFDRYLAPYTAAKSDVGAALDRLGTLTADNPNEVARIGSLRPLVAQKMDELQETVDLRKEKGFDAALAVIETDRGKATMDNIRGVLAQMLQEEANLLTQRSEKADSTSQLTYNTIIYGTIGAIAILIAIGALFATSITRPITAMVEALSSASAEILAGTTQQAAGMREQNSAVTETVATVDEVLQTAEQAAQRAISVSESSQRAADASEAGRKAVDESVEAMTVVRERTSTVAEGILALSGQAQSIGDIIASVNDITEQINLLSLNAAIEASRAGEHGRGFNVVASEIKVLADQSKRATMQVRQILGDIQKATNAAVMMTEQGTKSVADALKTITEAGTTIRMLAESANDAAEAAAQIAASAGQQTTGMRQIHQAMQNINQVSAQNLTATNQSEQAIRHLSDLGGGLKQLVA
ncbi:MAG TPA: CHASE3 domain-containing protein [Magnetospirillaceae bacterium]|jgi:methyl-accepting chemotaxis protein